MFLNANDFNRSSWKDLFLQVVEKFVPTIKFKDSKPPKWIDGEIVLLSKKRNYG